MICLSLLPEEIFMNNAIIELIKVHVRSFFREPGVVFWAVLFPVLMAWVLGLAFSEKSGIKATVYVVGQLDKDTITERRFQIEGLPSATVIDFKSASEEEALRAMKKGIISLYITREQGGYVYHYDPVNKEALSHHLLLERILAGNAGNMQMRAVTAPGNRYIDFLIPGLIALGIMNSCLWGLGYNLIEFRMKKLLRRMVATPMRKTDFFVSHALFRIAICFLETLILLFFAWISFGLVIQGSWLAFLILLLAGVICFSGIALLVASRTQNSQVGNGLINAVLLPMTILSGIFFSYHNFPEWAQAVIQYLPLTVLADAFRAIVNEGAGTGNTLFPVLLLVCVGLVCSIAGLKNFKWY